MTELTGKTSVVGDKVFSILDTNKLSVGLKRVLYGDDLGKIAETPTACVETGPKTNEFNGAPRRVMVIQDVYVIIYHERVSDSQQNQRASEILSDAVEDLLHQDATLGGVVISSYVRNTEPGYVVRGGAQIKASRLTFQTTSQVMLPFSA